MKITNGKGCQIIADPVGAQNALKNIACCSVDARWVLFGFLGGSKLQNFDLGPLLAKRIQLLTTTLKTRSDDYKANLIEKLSDYYFKSGKSFKQITDRVFKMSEVQEAHAYIESNQSVGKILL